MKVSKRKFLYSFESVDMRDAGLPDPYAVIRLPVIKHHRIEGNRTKIITDLDNTGFCGDWSLYCDQACILTPEKNVFEENHIREFVDDGRKFVEIMCIDGEFLLSDLARPEKRHKWSSVFLRRKVIRVENDGQEYDKMLRDMGAIDFDGDVIVDE